MRETGSGGWGVPLWAFYGVLHGEVLWCVAGFDTTGSDCESLYSISNY